MGSPDSESPRKTAHNHIRNIPIRPYPIYHENTPPYTLGHTSQSSNPCYSRVNCNAGYGNSHSTLQLGYMDWCTNMEKGTLMRALTLGYHICLTISSNCLVQRFLLIVAILYWGLWVIITCTWDGLWMWPRSRDDMDHGAWTWAVCVDPGPLVIWWIAHVHRLFWGPFQMILGCFQMTLGHILKPA